MLEIVAVLVGAQHAGDSGGVGGGDDGVGMPMDLGCPFTVPVHGRLMCLLT